MKISQSSGVRRRTSGRRESTFVHAFAMRFAAQMSRKSQVLAFGHIFGLAMVRFL